MIFSLAACGTQTEAEENEAEDVAEIPAEEQNAQADRNTDNTEAGRQEETEMKLQIEKKLLITKRSKMMEELYLITLVKKK